METKTWNFFFLMYSKYSFALCEYIMLLPIFYIPWLILLLELGHRNDDWRPPAVHMCSFLRYHSNLTLTTVESNWIYVEKVAIKMLDKLKLDNKTQRLLSREISIMEHLNHPNIVRIYEVVETISKLNIVLELCSGTLTYLF